LSSFDSSRHMSDPEDLPEVVRRLAGLRLPVNLADPRRMAGNAARCALELALLDAYTRRFDRSLSDAVRIALDVVHASADLKCPSPRPVRYSGAITAEAPDKERISAWKMRLYGFHQVKIKVGAEEQDDTARLARLRRILGRNMDIRLDANEAWPAAELVDRVS